MKMSRRNDDNNDEECWLAYHCEDQNREYYYCPTTNESTWIMPEQVKVDGGQPYQNYSSSSSSESDDYDYDTISTSTTLDSTSCEENTIDQEVEDGDVQYKRRSPVLFWFGTFSFLFLLSTTTMFYGGGGLSSSIKSSSSWWMCAFPYYYPIPIPPSAPLASTTSSEGEVEIDEQALLQEEENDEEDNSSAEIATNDKEEEEEEENDVQTIVREEANEEEEEQTPPAEDQGRAPEVTADSGQEEEEKDEEVGVNEQRPPKAEVNEEEPPRVAETTIDTEEEGDEVVGDVQPTPHTVTVKPEKEIVNNRSLSSASGYIEEASRAILASATTSESILHRLEMEMRVLELEERASDDEFAMEIYKKGGKNKKCKGPFSFLNPKCRMRNHD